MNAQHATTSKIGEDVVLRDPEVFEAPNFTNGDVSLRDEEIAFFKENGFLVKRRFFDDDETFAKIIDCIWENVPETICKRDDPTTWPGVPHGRWTDEDEERAGKFMPGSWRMRSRNGIGTEPLFLEKLANNPRMRQMVALFIGEPVKPLKRVRGVYVVFPKPPGTTGKLSPHADYTAAQLSAMIVVHDIPPKGGGFTIWPGSHRMLHPHWDSTLGSYISSDRADGYNKARDQALKDITPIELSGKPGDVIYWHPRLLHSGGINQTADLGKPNLRIIVPCDYQKDGFTFFDDPVGGPGPNHQWWVDTRNFREDAPATPDNMWDGWAI